MKPHLLPYESINIGERLRVDYGDVDDLARSISEIGLIQPVVIDAKYNLIAGGRRMAAMGKLGWKEVPVVLAEGCGDEMTLRIMELEENVRRKDMNWKEKVHCVARVHTLYRRQNATSDTGHKWTYERTGELLGISVGNVNYSLVVSKRLEDPNSPLHQCESLSDALRYLLKEKEDAANALLVKKSVPTLESLSQDYNIPEGKVERVFSEVCIACEGKGTNTHGEMCPICKGTGRGEKEEMHMVIPISQILFKGDCLDLSLVVGRVDHIITDPPYGIDMANLTQEKGGTFNDIESTVKEHDVEENLSLFEKFIPTAAAILPEGGWLCMWCDAMHFSLLHSLMKKAGFRVQRWPLIWTKSYPCANAAAGSNFTKATEFCIIGCKGVGTLISPQARNFYLDQGKTSLPHPFAKPIDVWQWVIRGIAKPGDHVLDPFAGCGSSLLAMLELGITPIGIEKVEEHFNAMNSILRQKYLDLFPDYKLTFI